MEVWKDVVGYEGIYQVSNIGKVKSLNYKNEGYERELKQDNNNGYRQVALTKDGKLRRHKVHRLVYEAFVQPIKDGMVVCHNDGDRANNHLSNLRMDTQSGNLADRKFHGTEITGEKNGSAKLTDEDVKEIRAFYAEHSRKERYGAKIHEAYGVTPGIICSIVTRKIWKHI